MKKIILAVAGLIILLITVLLFNTITFKSKQISVETVEPIAVEEDAYARLAEAIQFKTISVLSGKVTDSSAFLNLHSHISKSFPLVDSLLEKQCLGLSLLYTWEGSNPDLKPIILMSHQDVVPVDEPTKDDWEHPPFSGNITKTDVWGRG